MTHPRPRSIAPAALGLAASVLLAACGSSSPATSAHVDATSVHATDVGGTATSAAPADPASGPGTSVAATSSAPPNGAAHACALITEQEAGTALGADPGPGEEVSHLGASSCTYGAAPSLITVNLLPTGGKAAYDHARSVAPGGQLVDVSGVGDSAFGLFHNPVASIEFAKGDALVVVVLYGGKGSASLVAQINALAQSAAGRV